MSLYIEDIYNGWHLLRSTPISEEGSLIRNKGLREWYRSCTPYVNLLNGIISLIYTFIIFWNLYPYLSRLLSDGSKDIRNGLLLNFNRGTNYPCIGMNKNDSYELISYELILFKRDELNISYRWNLDPMSFFMMRAITMNYKEIKDGELPTFPTEFPFPNGMMNDGIKFRFLSIRNILREIGLNDSIPRDRLFDFSYSNVDHKHTITFNYLGNTSLTIVGSNEIIDRTNINVAGEHLGGMISKFTAWNNLIQSHSVYVDNNVYSNDIDISLNFSNVNRIINKPMDIIEYLHKDISMINISELQLILHMPGSKEGSSIGLGVNSLRIFRRLMDQWDAKVKGRPSNLRGKNILEKQILFNQGPSHLGPARKMFRLEKDGEEPVAFRLKYCGEGDRIYDSISARKEMEGIMDRFPINEGKNRLSLILNGVDDDGENHLDKVISAYYEHKIKDRCKIQRLQEDDDEEFDERMFGGNVEDSDREDDGASDFHYRSRGSYENIDVSTCVMGIASRRNSGNSYDGDINTSSNNTPLSLGSKPANEIVRMEPILDDE